MLLQLWGKTDPRLDLWIAFAYVLFGVHYKRKGILTEAMGYFVAGA